LLSLTPLSDDVFVIDTGAKLSVWVGRGASQAERRESMIRAAAYLTQNGYASNTPIERVAEGTESAQFKADFYQWDPPKPLTFAPRPPSGIATSRADTQIDVGSLLRNRPVEEQCLDDGSGKLDVWRVEDFKRVPVAPELLVALPAPLSHSSTVLGMANSLEGTAMSSCTLTRRMASRSS
jgi:hypothetical protein